MQLNISAEEIYKKSFTLKITEVLLGISDPIIIWCYFNGEPSKLKYFQHEKQI